jgi:hypothetical protein
MREARAELPDSDLHALTDQLPQASIKLRYPLNEDAGVFFSSA